MTEQRHVSDIVAYLETAYPPKFAESWDSVGLVVGEDSAPVSSVLVCVDVTDDVVNYAVSQGFTMIVAHHPLLLRGVTSVAANTAKGALVHRLIRHGIALFSAHTNADSASPGVSDALADMLKLQELEPLAPRNPEGDGAQKIGLGRVGNLSSAVTLADFSTTVARELRVVSPVRTAGDSNRIIRRVAVCGGAGDSLLLEARASGADVYVTADLRHHVVDEFLRDGGPALIDAGHWATEFPWCSQVVELLQKYSVNAAVYESATDPWTIVGVSSVF